MDVNNKYHDYCMIITTTDNQEVANNISYKLITDKISACVQMSNMQSIYYWQGKVENIQEIRIIIKTKNSHYQQIEDVIKKMHNYSLPQIIKIDITGGSKEYLKWIDENC